MYYDNNGKSLGVMKQPKNSKSNAEKQESALQAKSFNHHQDFGKSLLFFQTGDVTSAAF